MSFLYLTADRIGGPGGGSTVTHHELRALNELADAEENSCYSLSRPDLEGGGEEPWKWDQKARITDAVIRKPSPRLVHIYSGTFSETVVTLKGQGSKVVYTIAAHDKEVSRREHERLGLPFPYKHLTEETLWQRYIDGYRRADVIVCPSTVAANTVRRYGPDFADKQIEVIPHGTELPERVAPLPQRFTVGYLGSYGADKGVAYLLEAWKGLNYNDADLLLGGQDSKLVANAAKDIGVMNVHATGWLDNVSDFYDAISVYVQPSACLLPGSLVYSCKGPIPIEELTEDHKVLVDLGEYRKVITPLRRRFVGDLVSVRTIGIGIATAMTPEHRLLVIRRGLDTRLRRYEKKCRAYKTALRLNMEQGLGAVRLSRLLGFKPTTINGWLHYGAEPEGREANHSLKEEVLAKKPEWVSAGKLERGDVVLFPRIRTMIPREKIFLPRKVLGVHGNATKPLPAELVLNSEVMEFFGFYVAEGCGGGQSTLFCFHSEEKGFIRSILRVARTRFNLNAKVSFHKEKKSAVVRIGGVLLSKFLGKHFGRGAHNKTIPNWVLLLPDQQLIPFIRGAWLGDGSKWALEAGKRATSYSTVSRVLAYQMFAALVRLGYMPKLQLGTIRGGLGGGIHYSVSLNGNDALEFARQVLGKETSALRGTRGTRTHIDENFYYMPVTGLSRVSYAGDVYNLEVEGNHCYCAPFVVHNSEGFGIEVLEAMAHGRPVICSRGAGAQDVCFEEWKVPACDVDSLAVGIDEVKSVIDIDGPHWAVECRKVAEGYTWDKIRKQYQDLWRSLL